MTIKAVSFIARSGTGKTTLVEQVIAALKQRGYRVGALKHDAYKFEIDYPGKDSYELRKAGASQVLIGSRRRWALIVEREEKQDEPLEYHINHLDTEHLDIILVEGFKPEAIPKIEINRPSLGKPLLHPHDDSIFAIATDEPLTQETDLPVLDLNNPEAIAEFIIDRFLGDHQNIRTSNLPSI